MINQLEEFAIPASPARMHRPFPVLWKAMVLCGQFLVMQIGFIVLLTVPIAVVAVIAGVPFPETTLPAIVLIANSSATAAVIVTAWLWSGQPLKTLLPFRRFRVLMLLPLALTILGLHPLISEADNVLRHFLPIPDSLSGYMKGIVGQGWMSVLMVVVVAPITEEPLFRGIILRGFLGNYRGAWPAVLSSLLFAVIHLNPWQFIAAFALGLLFAWCFMHTGSLWPCLFGHALSNGLMMSVALLPFSLPNYNVRVDGSVLQPLWFDLAGVGILLAGIWWLHRIFVAEGLRAKAEALPVAPCEVQDQNETC